MEQIEQAVIYALGPQVDPNLKAQVLKRNFDDNISNPHLQSSSLNKDAGLATWYRVIMHAY